MSTPLKDARAALAAIASRHPTGSIAVGSQTHGGPTQYTPGCVAHGAWCSEWSITAKAVESFRALIAEHERLTAPPTDDEREAAALHLWDEGLVRPESLAFAVIDALIAEGYFRRQGPITDAQVKAAARVIAGAYGGEGYFYLSDARAALEAARAAS